MMRIIRNPKEKNFLIVKKMIVKNGKELEVKEVKMKMMRIVIIIIIIIIIEVIIIIIIEGGEEEGEAELEEGGGDLIEDLKNLIKV